MQQEQFMKRVEGILEGFHAFHEGQRINVCDGHYDTLFSVTSDWSADHLNQAIAIHRRAHAAGERAGRTDAQAAIRAAMGIES